MRFSAVVVGAWLVVGMAGCDRGDSGAASTDGADSKKSGKTGAKKKAKEDSAEDGADGGAGADGAVEKDDAPAVPKRFARDGIEPLADCLGGAHVLLDLKSSPETLAIAPLLIGAGFEVNASGAPKSAQIVSYIPYAMAEEPWYAKCGDAETCNEIAALLSRARTFPKPVLHCGLPPKAENRKMEDWFGGGTPKLPEKDQPQQLCGRLAGCQLDANPGLEPGAYNRCMKAPSTAKALCATKTSCAEVLSCVEG